MRILDRLSIDYETASFEYDEKSLDAATAAEKLNADPERVYKTIVTKSSEGNIFVFVLPSLLEISLKKARALTNSASIELLKESELRKYTGYIRGGCSPLGMIKRYPTYLLDLAKLEETIYISAGERGREIIIRPDDLIRAADANYADFA